MYISYIFTDYQTLFDRLTREWLDLEMRHRVSKSGTNDFWSVGLKLFPKVAEAKRNENILTKIPQFRSIREKMTKDNVPNIYLEVAYECKETGDVIIMKDLESTPVKQFPPSRFIKLYESAKVKVSSHTNICVCINS